MYQEEVSFFAAVFWDVTQCFKHCVTSKKRLRRRLNWSRYLQNLERGWTQPFKLQMLIAQGVLQASANMLHVKGKAIFMAHHVNSLSLTTFPWGGKLWKFRDHVKLLSIILGNKLKDLTAKANTRLYIVLVAEKLRLVSRSTWIIIE